MPFRPRLILRIAAAATLFAGALPAFLQESDKTDALKTADEIEAKVAKLRSLNSLAPIRKGIKTREEIAGFLQRRVREEYADEDLLREGLVLQKLGLVPPAIEYKAFMLKLLTEQVGGYYDPEEKTFFIAGWLAPELQKGIMAHELVHALQDQHFDLGKLMKEGRSLNNDDRQLARQAIYEGDAMAVMMDYLLEPAGRDFTSLPDLVFVMRAQMSSMDAQFEVFRQAPAVLKEMLLFPYGYGAAFLQKVRAGKPWSTVDKIYADLPVSTEQVLHPEKYTGERDLPETVEAVDPAPRLGESWKTSYRNVLGEFALFLLLKDRLPEERSRRAAMGWDGDSVLLLEGPNGAAFLTGESVWDSPDDAEEFYAALRDLMRSRYGEGKDRTPPAQGFSVSKDGESWSVERTASRVKYVFGLPAGLAAKLGL